MKKRAVTISLMILFSIVLWISVSLSGEYIATVHFPVRITDVPKNNAVGAISTSEIFIQLKGNGWNLAKIILGPKEEFLISARRKMGRHNENFRTFLEKNSWITSRFQVIEISPANVEFDIGKVVSKKVKIYRDLDVTFKEGFGPASDVIALPESVEIYGPQSLLNTIDSVKTIHEELSNVSENVNLELKLEKIDGIDYEINSCNISYDVQKIVDKEIDNITVESNNVPYGKDLVFFPSKVKIIVRGGIEKVGRLTSDSVKIYVNYWETLKENDATIIPQIELPKYIKLLSVEPNQLEFIIKQY